MAVASCELSVDDKASTNHCIRHDQCTVREMTLLTSALNFSFYKVNEVSWYLRLVEWNRNGSQKFPRVGLEPT